LLSIHKTKTYLHLQYNSNIKPINNKPLTHV
jgi:hypothetical protein